MSMSQHNMSISYSKEEMEIAAALVRLSDGIVLKSVDKFHNHDNLKHEWDGYATNSDLKKNVQRHISKKEKKNKRRSNACIDPRRISGSKKRRLGSYLQCHYCPKLYPNAQSRRSHERIHSNERPFPCPESGCELSFKRGSDLSRHVNNKHLKIRFKCTECTKLFHAKYDRKLHAFNKHKVIILD